MKQGNFLSIPGYVDDLEKQSRYDSVNLFLYNTNYFTYWQPQFHTVLPFVYFRATNYLFIYFVHKKREITTIL